MDEQSMSLEDMAAEYFRSVLLIKSPREPFPLVRLIGHRAQAPAGICNNIRTVNDLKTLFEHYPDTFAVTRSGKNVRLVECNGHKNSEPSANDTQTSTITVPENQSGMPFRRSTESFLNNFERNMEELRKGLETFFINNKISLPDNNITATDFFLQILQKPQPFNIVPIVDLFKNRLSAPLHVQLKCGYSLEAFKEFLSQFPEEFIVTGEYVLARKNIPKESWCPPTKSIEEDLSSVIANFFKLYTQHGKPVHISKLFNDTGKCFVSNKGEMLLKSPEELTKFLRMFPEYFYVFNEHVVNILNYDKDGLKDVCRKKSERKKELDQSSSNQVDTITGIMSKEVSENWKVDVLSRTERIDDYETCQLVAKDLLDKEKVIALDCEGLNLGADGTMSTIQIGTETGEVYIFDILTTPSMLGIGHLKELCESKNVLKVIHDCRNDSANLHHEFSVTLKNIFDTRIAHGLISKRHNKPIAFNDLCRTYGAPINVEKDEFKDIYKTNPAFWLTRPFTETMLAYAALDVACLVPHVYNNMMTQLKDSKDKVLQLSEKASKSAI